MSMYQSQIEQRQNVQTIVKSSRLKAVLHALLFSITVILLLSLGTASALSAPKGKPAFPVVSLPSNAQGDRAIEFLSDKLPEVAAWYGSTPEEFSTMLREDHTARIDKDGHLFFVEETPIKPMKVKPHLFLQHHFHTTKHLNCIVFQVLKGSFISTSMVILPQVLPGIHHILTRSFLLRMI